ncbi:MAG: helix-turn-helix transcriptional regulator [Erysipelotrichales bacterium]|nr:helix-turn-helix transcriptional regulator [Erysipelotrichales bacterium]
MNRLEELSKEFGYKQKDYEKLIGLSRNIIINIQSQRTGFDSEKLCLLCDLLQVTTDYFLCRSNEGIIVEALGKKFTLSKEKFLLYKQAGKISYPNNIRTLNIDSSDDITLVEGKAPLIQLKNDIL